MGSIENIAIEQPEQENGKIYQFKGTIINDGTDLLEKECTKISLDGSIKKTKNNSKRNRDQVMYIPESDIPKIHEYLKNKIDTAKNSLERMAYIRNMCYFSMGINIAVRVSDLITLKWSDVYNIDYTFREGKIITPKKTKNKSKHILLRYNDDFKAAVEYWKENCGHEIRYDDYIFRGMVFEKGDKRGHISDAAIEYMLKDVQKSLGLKYNINTHSLRKTFCRAFYEHASDKEDALIMLSVILNHSSVKITRDYICITKEQIEDAFDSVKFDSFSL